MKNLKIISYASLILLFSITACSIKVASKSKSSPSKKIKNVVILGDSIVAHPISEKIGWYGDWGMAASVRDSDFVHLLIAQIHQFDESVNVRFVNIATFERNYETYDLSQLAAYKDADMLIVKLSENVKSHTAVEKEFIHFYDRLLRYLAPTDTTVKIVVDGFWPSPVNDILKEYSQENNYPFVTIHDLFRDDPANSAKGLFENEGVAKHPSDKGMRNIAIRIWNCIAEYFPQ